MSNPPTIRPMSAGDVAPAADALRRGEFGDREDFFHWALGRPNVDVLVADADGEIIGTGTASAHGPVGWVGVIFVAPGWRGSGLGRRSPGRSWTGSRRPAAAPWSSSPRRWAARSTSARGSR